MDGVVSGEANPSQLTSYGGDDPLAIAMAQSGIESGESWAFLDICAQPGSDLNYGQVSACLTGSSFSTMLARPGAALSGQVLALQPGDEEQLNEQMADQLEDQLDGMLGDQLESRLEDRLAYKMEGKVEDQLEDSTEGPAVDGALDRWLSSYYYTVSADAEDAGLDPDDPDHDLDLTGHLGADADLAPASVLPRLVASLGWTDTDRRPPYTFEELAALAICSSPERRLTASLAADFVRRVYPFYQHHETRLQACLEQALFTSPYFRRLAGRGPLGRPWTVTAEGERRLAAAVRRRLADPDQLWRPVRPAWREDHCYAAPQPAGAVGRRRVKLATKT